MGWEFVYLFHYHCTHSRSIGSGILISSNHCTHSRWIWRSMGVVILLSSYRFTHSKVNLKFHGGRNFDIFRPLYMGILISSCHCTHSKVYLKFHGGGVFDIFLPLYTLKVNLKFHGGGNFDIFLTLYTFKVNLKFHGGGNFDIFWTLHTLKGQFEVTPMSVRIFWYLLPTIVHTQRWIWSSMGWEFDIVLLVHTLNVNLKFHGGGNFDVFLITIAATQRSIWRSMGVIFFVSSYRSTNWRSNWSFMGVGILLSSDHCTLKGQFEVPWGWEIWYLLSGAHTQCQFEGPWGWEFLYLLAIVHTQRFIWSSTGWDFWYLLIKLYTFKVNLKFHGGGIWISSCPCTHSRSIWISWGFPRVGMRSYREGVRSCATRRPALHKRSCAIRGVAYLQSGWYRIAVGRHTMSSKGARSSVNVECGLRWK